MEWAYWGNAGNDYAAADIAAVIVTIIGHRSDADAGHNGHAAYLAASKEHDRPSP